MSLLYLRQNFTRALRERERERFREHGRRRTQASKGKHTKGSNEDARRGARGRLPRGSSGVTRHRALRRLPAAQRSGRVLRANAAAAGDPSETLDTNTYSAVAAARKRAGKQELGDRQSADAEGEGETDQGAPQK